MLKISALQVFGLNLSGFHCICMDGHCIGETFKHRVHLRYLGVQIVHIEEMHLPAFALHFHSSSIVVIVQTLTVFIHSMRTN